VAAAAPRLYHAGAHRTPEDPAGAVDVHPRRNPISGELDGYDFAGPTRFDRLFTGIAVERPAWVAEYGTTGCEGISPEETFDRDYGRLLDRAYERALKCERPQQELSLVAHRQSLALPRDSLMRTSMRDAWSGVSNRDGVGRARLQGRPTSSSNASRSKPSTDLEPVEAERARAPG
jgi:hypothetical protein